MPGEPIDIGPAAGDELGVIGVAHDDVLNVRKAPGTDQPILTTLAPTADDVIAMGAARQLPSSIWYHVTANGTTGWVNGSYVAYLGTVDDVTSAIVAGLGEIPTADSMLALGTLVAEAVASDEEPVSKVTVTVAPTVGDLGEITMDVVGLGRRLGSRSPTAHLRNARRNRGELLPRGRGTNTALWARCHGRGSLRVTHARVPLPPATMPATRRAGIVVSQA